jgi:hypothetical protein
MPGGDRTGPMGNGPKTGWGRGFCGGAEVQGFGRGGWGRGMGRGRGGGGLGWRHQHRAAGNFGWNRGDWDPPAHLEAEPSMELERTRLEVLVADLEGELDRIKSRMIELDARPKAAE